MLCVAAIVEVATWKLSWPDCGISFTAKSDSVSEFELLMSRSFVIEHEIWRFPIAVSFLDRHRFALS